MTIPQRFEQDLPVLLEDLYLVGTPDYRDDLIERIAATPQRPAWAFPRRWIPMDSRRIAPTRGPWRTVGVLAMIGILLVATLGMFIGSRQRLPEPFGLASNGPLVYAANGDIYVRDTLDAVPRAIVTGPENDVHAVYSPRGDRLAVVRLVPDGEELYVGRADGSDLRHVAGPWLQMDWAEFSPDGSLLAVQHTRKGLPLIELVATDGSSSRRVGDFPAMAPTFRPPDGRQLLFRGQEGGRWSFYLVDVAGGDPVRLDIEGDRLEGGGYDLESPAWSPTGDRLAFHSLVRLPESLGQTNGHRINVADIDRAGQVSAVRPLEFDPTSDDEMFAQFTPDGTRLVFMQRFGLLGMTDFTDALWIASADGGPATPLGIESSNGDGLAATIAPDGTSLLAHLWAESEDWLIDPVTGSAALTDLDSSGGASWQRTAP
jgi:hypothetical protein